MSDFNTTQLINTNKSIIAHYIITLKKQEELCKRKNV